MAVWMWLAPVPSAGVVVPELASTVVRVSVEPVSVEALDVEEVSDSVVEVGWEASATVLVVVL
jgi:hypothetical protein